MDNYKFKTTLSLYTNHKVDQIKGLDSIFEAIVDKKNRLIALVPIEHSELVLLLGSE